CTTLTSIQIARVAAHGSRRRLKSGEVIVQPGDSPVPFFVVTQGELETIKPSGPTETLIAVPTPGLFTGEANSISGRRASFRIRARRESELSALTHKQLIALVQDGTE